MSLEAEALVDRRLLQRRLSFWRVCALITGFIVILLYLSLSGTLPISGTQHIARVDINGVITDNRLQQELLEKISEDKNVKAVLLHINSPGGTTTGGEALFEAIRKVRKKKPVVAVFGTIATSAAYIAGMATDHIVARGNTITGSVGVIFQWAELSQLLEKVGVNMREIKSGPLKASPSPFEPPNEASLEVIKEMTADSQKWFLSIVKERRKLDPGSVPGLVDGKIFTGRQAIIHKLIDEIGGEDVALNWLYVKHNVPKNLKIQDWKVDQLENYGFLSSLSALILKKMGLDHSIFNKNLGLARLNLDGLVSVWHPK